MALAEDEVRVLMAEIDRLWSPATVAVTGLAVPPDDEDYTFVRMLIEAIEHFKSTGKSPSERTKKEVKQVFSGFGALTRRQPNYSAHGREAGNVLSLAGSDEGRQPEKQEGLNSLTPSVELLKRRQLRKS